MKKLVLSGVAGLLAIAVLGTPIGLRAQATNAPVVEKKASTKKSNNNAIPFRGNVKAIDNNAKTLSVGKETFQITSETRIIKMGKPATLADGAVGDQVGGQYHKDADGKLTATSVRFGPKAPVEESGATKTKTKAKTP